MQSQFEGLLTQPDPVSEDSKVTAEMIKDHSNGMNLHELEKKYKVTGLIICRLLIKAGVKYKDDDGKDINAGKPKRVRKPPVKTQLDLAHEFKTAEIKNEFNNDERTA